MVKVLSMMLMKIKVILLVEVVNFREKNKTKRPCEATAKERSS